MKRSQINAAIRWAIDFCEEHQFKLPLWAYWKPARWARVGKQADEIRQRMLGWDVTDFGSGEFAKCGLTLFTIRNGQFSAKKDPMVKDYCEKLLLCGENQVTPMHFHWAKMEDIINRGGGRLVIQLFNATKDGKLDKRKSITVSIDGIQTKVPAGGKVVLKPGQSITLTPYLYHTFWAQKGLGPVLGGEVSRVNDDAKDNRFLEPLPRFPAIEEDKAPAYLLCTGYPKA